MTREDFEKLLADAILELPKRFRDKMDNVGIVIEDFPTAAQLKRGGITSGGWLLGLYEGVPHTKRGPYYTLALPDKITIFQGSIEAIVRTPEAIKEQVRNTVRHEIAHHFGFDEAGARRLDHKRRKP